MEGLSIEVLERIVRKLDHISMCRLASMSIRAREGVHSYCSSHLRRLANQDNTTGASLEASGWQAGNDHDMWECPCICLVVGPWHWGVRGRKKEVIVDPDTSKFEASCTVVNNRLFTSLETAYHYMNNTTVIVRTRDKLKQLQEVIGLHMKKTIPSRASGHLINCENTLVVKFIKYLDFKDYAILVYNSESLQKVCDIDVMGTISDKSLKKHLEIPDIKMCRNKIAIHLMFGNSQAAQNVTQIWSVDTKSPQKESIFLAKTVTHSFDGLIKDEGGLLALNSSYLVKIGQENLGTIYESESSWANDKNMIHYRSLNNDNVNQNIPLSVSYNNLDIINVWHVSIIPGSGSILCLGLHRIHSLDGPHPMPEFRFQHCVQLFDLSTQQVVLENQLAKSHQLAPETDVPLISWWSDHLAVLVRDNDSSASLYTWSPGQSEIIQIRIKFKSGGFDWRFKYFHMDYQGIVIAKANSDRQTAFQCYKYKIEKEK